MRLCSGCGTKVPDSVRFCDECRAERGGVALDDIKTHTPGTTDRDRYAHLYAGNRFQDGVRPRVLQRDPFCKRCDVEPSVIVDHIVPAGIAIAQARASGKWPFDPNAGFYLMSNLQGLCRSCHGLKTVEDKQHAGVWPDVVAIEAAAPKKVWSF